MYDARLREVMLCSEYSGWEGVIHDRCWVEPKLDGFRLAVVVSGDCSCRSIAYFCRDLQEQVSWGENLGHVGEAIQWGLEQGPAHLLLDGEVVARDWGRLSSLLRRKRGNMSQEDRDRIADEVRFSVFDAVDLDAVPRLEAHLRGKKPVPTYRTLLEARRELARDIVYRGGEPLQLVPRYEARSEDELMQIYADYMDHGYEGAILKMPGSPYASGRHAYWQKLKPRETRNLEVRGFVEGKGKHAGRLGAISGVDELGRSVSIGGGFTDAQREWIWARRDDLVGHTVEFECQVGDVATARHPNFIRDRADKNPRAWFTSTD